MSLQLSVLGSGSGGNATLLRIEEEGQQRHILIDAGFSPRVISKRLAPLGVERDQIEAIVLTHMHSDHIRDTWLDVCKAQDIRVYLHQKHYKLWCKLGRYDIPVTQFTDTFDLTPTTTVSPFTLPHDQQTSTGLLIEHEGLRLGYLTDLGHVPEGVYEHFRGMDLLAIESNYDPQRQRNSPRPAFLKRRVMGPYGHLSNEQCLEAVKRFAPHSGMRQVLLLHLSQQCNDPALVRALYEAEAPALLDRIIPTSQREATPWIDLLPAPAPAVPLELLQAAKPRAPVPQMELF